MKQKQKKSRLRECLSVDDALVDLRTVVPELKRLKTPNNPKRLRNVLAKAGGKLDQTLLNYPNLLSGEEVTETQSRSRAMLASRPGMGACLDKAEQFMTYF